MYQFFLNLPFGETMAEQTSISYYQTEFKFNGKELDSETGMYYYGARYYDPSLSIWMSVDPLAEQFPNFSPYNYTMNNPINMVDPDGRAPEVKDDIIIHGINNVTLTIPTAGDEDFHVYTPMAISGESRQLNLGLENVDSDRFAIGYTVNATGSASTVLGAKGSAGITSVQFTDDTYMGYNYHYATGEGTGSTGVQGGASIGVELNVFIAYNNSNEEITPSTLSGTATSYELSGDFKTSVGGVGLTFGGFESGNWKGFYIGGEVGFGGEATILSFGRGESYSELLNNTKPTSERSLVDRVVNNHPDMKVRIAQAMYQYGTNN
ncbi:hypothetical protein BBFL7_02578 [Flavobacteria bacterium BBFL7]|nr:hypothetical protein BBFL7_02578 [Flavobacteria bacterium BBFL7]